MTASLSRAAPQARLRVRIALFITSLAPVFPLLAIRIAFTNVPVAVALALIAIFPIALAREFGQVLSSGGDGFVVDEVRVYDEGFANYALGFLLPAIMVPLDDPGAVTAMAAFWLFFGWIWVHGYLGHQNPALAVMGWHCWQVTVHRNGSTNPIPEPAILLTNLEVIGKGTTVVVGAYDGQVWYARKAKGVPSHG